MFRVSAVLCAVAVSLSANGCSHDGGMGPSVLPVASEAQSRLPSRTGGQDSGMQSNATYAFLRSPLAHLGCQLFPEQPCRVGMQLAPPEVHVGPARLPATATGAAKPARCREKSLYGEVCGTVSVPLDREHPKNGSIDVYFELFPHMRYGPPVSAIVWNTGGPGAATTEPIDTSVILSLVGQNLDVHDLLLIDDRGEGLSGTIDCMPLQRGIDPWNEGLTDCAAQLGGGASRYGSGDVAKDIDDVRVALGYDKIDYYVVSWGGADATAYAARFGSHLRSLVLDAPVGPTDMPDVLRTFRYETQTEPRMVRLACTYSPTCRADHPNPDAELKWLVDRVRSRPLSGRAYDANGKLTQVNINESNLAYYIIHSPTGNFVSTGEIVAAARALSKSDPAPLLRLEAEAYYPYPNGINYGDPTVYSVGLEAANACADATLPWSWKVRPAARLEQLADAIAALPSDYYAPFSKKAASGLPYNDTIPLCAWWELPTPPSRIAPPGAKYPDVPTLVMSGDMDDVVPYEGVSRVAKLFSRSSLFEVAESGHGTMSYSHCSAVLESQFIETLQVGNTDCLQRPDTVFPAVGRFPVVAADARPAAIDPGGHNQVNVAERRAVTVAVAAAVDALKRSTIGSGSDACLRAGSFKTAYQPAEWVLTLKGCSFSTDVGVSGTVTWGARRSVTADLALSGSGTTSGTIRISGTFQAQGRVKNFKISGALGGRNVALLVPEA
jgi:pimeloyl-ACP methyl ester carboxylesterase